MCRKSVLGDREFARYTAGEFRTLCRESAGDPLQIGGCELMDDVLAIILARGGIRNIISRTDNHNAMSWVSRESSNSPAPIRLLRHLCLACLVYGVDVIPVYIRGERNIAADNLTRRSDEEVEQFSQQEGMEVANSSAALWKSIELPDNAPVDCHPAEHFRDDQFGHAILQRL